MTKSPWMARQKRAQQLLRERRLLQYSGNIVLVNDNDENMGSSPESTVRKSGPKKPEAVETNERDTPSSQTSSVSSSPASTPDRSFVSMKSEHASVTATANSTDYRRMKRLMMRREARWAQKTTQTPPRAKEKRPAAQAKENNPTTRPPATGLIAKLPVHRLKPQQQQRLDGQKKPQQPLPQEKSRQPAKAQRPQQHLEETRQSRAREPQPQERQSITQDGQTSRRQQPSPDRPPPPPNTADRKEESPPERSSKRPSAPSPEKPTSKIPQHQSAQRPKSRPKTRPCPEMILDAAGIPMRTRRLQPPMMDDDEDDEEPGPITIRRLESPVIQEMINPHGGIEAIEMSSALRSSTPSSSKPPAARPTYRTLPRPVVEVGVDGEIEVVSPNTSPAQRTANLRARARAFRARRKQEKREESSSPAAKSLEKHQVLSYSDNVTIDYANMTVVRVETKSRSRRRSDTRDEETREAAAVIEESPRVHHHIQQSQVVSSQPQKISGANSAPLKRIQVARNPGQPPIPEVEQPDKGRVRSTPRVLFPASTPYTQPTQDLVKTKEQHVDPSPASTSPARVLSSATTPPRPHVRPPPPPPSPRNQAPGSGSTPSPRQRVNQRSSPAGNPMTSPSRNPNPPRPTNQAGTKSPPCKIDRIDNEYVQQHMSPASNSSNGSYIVSSPEGTASTHASSGSAGPYVAVGYMKEPNLEEVHIATTAPESIPVDEVSGDSSSGRGTRRDLLGSSPSTQPKGTDSQGSGSKFLADTPVYSPAAYESLEQSADAASKFQLDEPGDAWSSISAYKVVKEDGDDDEPDWSVIEQDGSNASGSPSPCDAPEPDWSNSVEWIGEPGVTSDDDEGIISKAKAIISRRIEDDGTPLSAPMDERQQENEMKSRQQDAPHSNAELEEEPSDEEDARQSSSIFRPSPRSGVVSRRRESDGGESTDEPGAIAPRAISRGVDNARKEVRLIVLVSTILTDRLQKSNQQRAITILTARRTPHEKIDGMDPKFASVRDELFEVSGVRGKYPQFFLMDRYGDTTYVGGWEEMEVINEASLLPYKVLKATPSIKTWEMVFGRCVASFS